MLQTLHGTHVAHVGNFVYRTSKYEFPYAELKIAQHVPLKLQFGAKKDIATCFSFRNSAPKCLPVNMIKYYVE